MGSKLVDISGQRFGMLVAVKRIAIKPRRGSLWECKCDCGNTKAIFQCQLRQGKTKSCGCFFKKNVGKWNTTHGCSMTKAFRSWMGMIRRCHSEHDAAFARYGGRGIKVCEEWRNSFDAFLRDMGHPPTAKHSIGRIDNDGHYQKDNCEWQTAAQQNANRSNSVFITIDGKTKCVSEWCRHFGVNVPAAFARIKYGWDPVRVFTTPIRHYWNRIEPPDQQSG